MVHVEDKLWKRGTLFQYTHTNDAPTRFLVYRHISCKMVKSINVISGSFNILFEIN